MNPHSWLICIWLAVAGTCAQLEDTVMTWHIGPDGRNETLQFTGEKFAVFSRCVCIGTLKCTVYTKDGFMSYLQWGDAGSTQGYTSTYICERTSNPALVVGCSRLELSSCSVVDSYPFWSFSKIASQESCSIGQVKITWNSTQLFQMTYNNTRLAISNGNLTCSSPPVSVTTTPLTTPSSQGTTKNSSCLPACATTSATNTTPKRITSKTTQKSDNDDPTPTTNITTNGINDKTTQSSDDDTGVIIGVVVAVIVCAVIVAVGFIVWWRKKKVQKAEKYGNSQLSSQPVEIIRGGFNGFAGQGSRGRPSGNAYVTDSTEPSYATVSADHANASYYNLKHNGHTSASAYENAGGSASVAPGGGDYRNVSRFGQDAAGYEVPLPATASQAQSQSYPNTPKNQVQGDGMEYEDVHDSSDVHLEASHGYGSQFQPNDDSYEIPVNPGGGLEASDKNVMSKGDSRYESVHPKGPGMENVYSEVSDNADNINHDDIVPPKRNRFMQPPSQAQTQQPSVYELAQPINERSANPKLNNDNSSTVHGPYARLGVNQSTPVNPYNCEGGNGDVYDSGSNTYCELESRASIRVKDTDSNKDSYPYPYSGAEPTEHPYEDPDKKTDKDPHYYDL